VDGLAIMAQLVIGAGAALFALGDQTRCRRPQRTTTVEMHVSCVLRKLQLSSRHELTAWALERKLL
jgi:hypothetical protein